MIVIRRMVDRRRAYTAIFLPGEAPKIFPTDDAEHARILQVYKQDRPHDGILNDFSEFDVPRTSSTPASTAPSTPRAVPNPWPLGKSARRPATKKTAPSPALATKPVSPKKKSISRKTTPQSLWLIPIAAQV